jgi:hypothetical protein
MGWAFLFLAISIGPSFRLANENFMIDLLPDFVGYLMIATAANRLIPVQHRARSIRNLALLLTYLSIPTIIQYTVVTSQSTNITTWTAPLWPLTVATGLLELGLVWMLCGLVADLARRALDHTTERLAHARRVVYILLKILLTAGLGLVLLAPNRELIIGGAIAGVAIGLILLGLMMGLMRRAERMAATWQEVALPIEGNAEPTRPGGWAFRLLALGSVVLSVALAAGGYCYYLAWDQERTAAWNNFDESAIGKFYDHLLAGRIDEAYEMTTVAFKSRVSREQLAELARKYVAYKNQLVRGPQGLLVKGEGASSSGPAGGDRGALDLQHMTQSQYKTMVDGRTTQVTITLRRDPDSIWLRKPPPVKVDDFKIE